MTPLDRARLTELEEENRKLRMENEFLKKSRCLLRADAAVAERCALIDAEKANYPVVWMCHQLSVPRSTFYAWARRVGTVSATAARRSELAASVRVVFAEHRRTYGCRRIAAVLNRRGTPVSVGLVADLMREQHLQAVQPRAWRRTTLPGGTAPPAHDVIGRGFTADRPGQRLVGDITYLRTGEGWRYLAVVLDLATRMVVGWQTADHLRTNLVTDAMRMARDGGHLPAGAVFHSDRGCQYSSTSTRSRPAPKHGSPSLNTSRFSTTARGYIPPSAIAPPPRSSPSTAAPRRQPDALDLVQDP